MELFSRCPTCKGIDTRAVPNPAPNPTPAMACSGCGAFFTVDETAVRPDGFTAAVHAVNRALSADQLLWIDTPDNAAAKAWGGPREAAYLAAEVATDAVFRTLEQRAQASP